MRYSELSAEEYLKAKVDGMLATIAGYDNYYSLVQVTMNRDRTSEERKVFSGSVDGVNLGAPVISTLSESGEQQIKTEESPNKLQNQGLNPDSLCVYRHVQLCINSYL